MESRTLTAAQEWRAGWKTVLSGFIGFYSFSVMISAMSAFMGPLAEEFGWSRTLLSAGTGISSNVTALPTRLSSILLDRYGSRNLALPGIFLSAVAVVAMATNNGSQVYWIALWLFYALAGLAVNTPTWTAAVARLFERSQGLALAVILAGATAAHASIPPLSVYLIDLVGWRMAFIWLGAGIGGLAFIICFFLFHVAHDRPSTDPDGDEAEPAPPARELHGLTMPEAWRSRALWQIGISILVIMLLTIGFLVHQIEILVGTGVSRVEAAGFAGLAGAMGIVGKLVTGFLIDRYPGNWVGGITMALAGVAFAMLLSDTPSTVLIALAMMVNGYTAGAKLHIASYLTVQYAGLRNFGKIYGIISSLVAAGSGLGPIVAGLVFDVSGSYSAFLMAGTVALAFSALLLLLLPRYPDWKTHGREQLVSA